MYRILFALFLLSLPLTSLFSQEITIQPYLQDASPNSITIMWETDSGEASVVDWGLTEALDNLATGIAYPSLGDARVHEVQLTGLERFTRYFYRVSTGDAVSEIYEFKTPPFASDKESFRIVAMSDMQRDNSHPDKFREIVEEGVIQYLEQDLGGDLTDNLALVMIPGDLVANGNNFGEWRQTFFDPADSLFSQIPVYPVLGNHEYNSSYYFTYFKMPENGTPGYEEHWWYKDYGNVRIIGLDSNGSFANADQLNWLSNLLDSSCQSDSIDFVFAQLHHPHKSELWTPGESDFTGEVIELLEQFSTNCGKPSIHFFGHTHGYSRGQSRDHKHLWINVATAGGAIDNWGEFPNFDYDEFSVSQDEYGFVVVEVTAGEDPMLTVKRIGRGDQDVIEENVLRDSLVLRLNPGQVDTPQAVFPIGEEIAPECVYLEATPFSSPESEAIHGQSHWQVTTYFNGFDDPVAERWRNFENWYFETDTQAGDDLTDEEISGLEAYTTYLWRVRYRDRALNWSAWSDPVAFSTGQSLVSDNLLQNPGSEAGLDSWETLEGVVESLGDLECNGINAHTGEKYFAVGGLCEHSEVGIAVQSVDISSFADSVDMELLQVHFGGYLSNYGGADLPEMYIVFLDESGLETGSSDTLSTYNNSWTLVNAWEQIPVQTRSVQVVLKGTRNTGTDNDSYFDDLFLKVGLEEVDCNTFSSVIVPNHPPLAMLNIYPNPATNVCSVEVPEGLEGQLSVHLLDTVGRKVPCSFRQTAMGLELDGSRLAPGTYTVWVRSGRKVIGSGQVVFIP